VSTTAPPRPPSPSGETPPSIPHTPTERPTPPPSWGSSVLAPVGAGTATICAATSLTGVVGGWAWLGYVIVAVVLVGCTGLALRSMRTPTPVVGLSQLAVLAMMITGVFTHSGILVIFPGPGAFGELRDVLVASFDQIRIGLPPVDPTPPILCLVTIAIGLVAVLVDTLTVAAAAPAATGLVLLCVYAVPASLSDKMLPWWTFLLGAAAFAGLLAVDGNHRHRRWRNRDAPGLGAGPAATSTPVAVVAVALVLGLVVGSSVTAVGTVGRLPGSGQNGQGAGSGGLGVNPFTSLRGMLDQGTNTDLFRVRGLGDEKRLLRAFTLDTYRPNKGWGLPDAPMPAGVPANQPLPAAPGDDGTSQSREVQIEPVNWVDVWMPIYGAPRGLRNVPPGWYYDPSSGAVFSERKQHVPAYTESASLAEPSKNELRAASVKPGQVSPVYTRVDQVDPRVVDLTKRITENKTTNFDKATALWQFFTAQNGFTYDTQTAAAADSDALTDFLLKGKRGFCEQFASAMGVMLRVLGIPARVAVGFTTGLANGDVRTITSQDAHAWVEVYFGDRGWVSFDPTPLADGRGYIPAYLRPDNTAGSSSSDSPEDQPSTAPRQPPTGAAQQPETGGTAANPDQAAQNDATPGWIGWAALVFAILAAIVTLGVLVLGRRAAAARRHERRDGEDSAADARSGVSRMLDSAIASWLPLAATGLWVLAIGFAAWLWSFWFALALFVVLSLALAPAVVREVARRRRLHEIAARGPGAADAAWHELMAECADRGVPIPDSDTIRNAAQKVSHRHHLDDEGKDGLRTVVGLVERSWYSPEPGGHDTLGPAFEELRESLHRNAPISWRGRLLPKSLFRRPRT
jgi:transglutaminase-like putative cysteine protease